MRSQVGLLKWWFLNFGGLWVLNLGMNHHNGKSDWMSCSKYEISELWSIKPVEPRYLGCSAEISFLVFGFFCIYGQYSVFKRLFISLNFHSVQKLQMKEIGERWIELPRSHSCFSRRYNFCGCMKVQILLLGAKGNTPATWGYHTLSKNERGQKCFLILSLHLL